MSIANFALPNCKINVGFFKRTSATIAWKTGSILLLLMLIFVLVLFIFLVWFCKQAVLERGSENWFSKDSLGKQLQSESCFNKIDGCRPTLLGKYNNTRSSIIVQPFSEQLFSTKA